MEPFACDALPGRVVFGAGAARTELAGEVARLGVSRLLLIAGGGAESVARDLAAPAGAATASSEVVRTVTGR
jgi:maleylacetate reductase